MKWPFGKRHLCPSNHTITIASPEAVAKGHSAGEIIQALCRNLGGKGGGKPDFAMGGAKDEGRLPAVLEELRKSL